MSKFFIETEFYKRNVLTPMVVIDGGARGEVFPPFNEIKSDLEVVAFDPDPEADISNDNDHFKKIIIPKALWNTSESINLHIAVDPSTSSVYPPNVELLNKFDPIYAGDVRVTEKIISVDGTSIDECIYKKQFASPDFIKLDVHSAEHEALSGSKKALTDSVLGVLVETWHHPIHEGQYLHSDVESFLNENDFFLFDQYPVGRWDFKKNGIVRKMNKACYVLSESLFFKILSKFNNKSAMLKQIALYDLFGYSNLAINSFEENSEYFSTEEIEEFYSIFRQLESQRFTFRDVVKSKVIKLAKSIFRKI